MQNKRQTRFSEFLVCQAFVSVGKMDDSAISEAGLKYTVLHDMVVTVSVYTEIAAPLRAPAETGLGNTVTVRSRCKTVYGCIRRGVIQPGSRFDDAIGRLDSGNEGECAHDDAVILNHITHSFVNIPPYHIHGRIAVRPLVKVAVCTHDLLCLRENFKHARQVRLGGVSDAVGNHFAKLAIFVLERTANFAYLYILITTLMDTGKLFGIASRFGIDATEIKPLGEGFINDTFLVWNGGIEPAYILQRKNHIVFPDVPGMMDNIQRVTAHIRTKVDDPLRGTLTVVCTTDGIPYFKDENGNFWAVCVFIPKSKSYSQADSCELAYQGGRGLGIFHKQVSDFTEPLAEVIKGFHNIRFRFSQWDSCIAADKAGRCAGCKEEISWIESRRRKMLAFWEKYEKGIIPTRVTHNDTKISNFLFDAEDSSFLCAIDLDTLASSTLLNDMGDMLRSYTNTGAEDDPDLSRVSMDFERFKAVMDGYIPQVKDILTKEEIENLAFSGVYITFEQVLRFLMDYLEGDHYYKIAYPEHNLVRTKAQYKLLTSMEEQLDKMQDYIDSLIA